MSTSSPKATEPSRSTLAVPPPGTNLVVLRGVLSRDPEPRQLPSGDALVAYEVTVRPGAGSDGPARAESVPVALAAGDEVVVVGRIRRRFFRAGGATASRTEVVAANVVSVRAPARARRALTALLADLDGGG
jgi:single-strand DNA-binding protein